MGVWDIDLAAATTTLTAAASQIETTQPSVAGMGKALQKTAEAIPPEAATVLNALNDVVELKLTPAATEVASRSETIITSTAKALAFYRQGDLDMAAVAQRSAAQVEAPDPSPVHGGPALPLRG
ncbi:DUF6507 family protein [Paenarthrobacter sp. NPDC089714]|uniref:DUF6507 family protein n=1 Tax=unclassified Paenarthrobacter TaxID=2634190 RepID=UPI0038245875